MNQRDEFEKWASEPPREWYVDRYPNDPARYSWPGLYFKPYVRTAWEAWQEATKRATK